MPDEWPTTPNRLTWSQTSAKVQSPRISTFQNGLPNPAVMHLSPLLPLHGEERRACHWSNYDRSNITANCLQPPPKSEWHLLVSLDDGFSCNSKFHCTAWMPGSPSTSHSHTPTPQRAPLPPNPALFKLLMDTYNALHNFGHTYLTSINFFKHTRHLRWVALLLEDSHCKGITRPSSRAVSFLALKSWNDLPLHIRASSSGLAFRKEVKTWILFRYMTTH